MDEPRSRDYAKKVIFLYPHSVIQDQLIAALIQSEYEVVTIGDHAKATMLLHRYHSAILFINIETGMDEPAWEQYIRTILGGQDKHDARVGILTYNPNPELAQKYLMEIGVQCGFIGLKLGLTESARIILRTLEANEARGARKYVRVKCPAGKSTLNINRNGRLISGEIVDLSSAGMACIIQQNLKPQSEIDDIQMILWGTRVKVAGVVMGQRAQEDGKIIHVLMFNDDIEKESRSKIFVFIRKVLQAEVDAL